MTPGWLKINWEDKTVSIDKDVSVKEFELAIAEIVLGIAKDGMNDPRD